MRFLVILILVGLVCFNTKALTPLEPEQDHSGSCPTYAMMCAIYCSRTSRSIMTPEKTNGCTRDSECASDEKCCKPACGCTNKCVKATTKSQSTLSP
ncbi:unnamed protein product [Adineta steineri]|uniref:WAP domain-containing protein n=1 Tax=Adineta steineri TaxID=433720 RepID=A0A819VTM4_9BILA|nr:unnamed protein product [Adineta steineri]CAF0893984.1 unnamed protein product [Adineta steineri]CAF4052091.1 unnamed protein product [Adineta steineri]CAF4113744.1 unnamed protein product [Adineta steineri]